MASRVPQPPPPPLPQDQAGVQIPQQPASRDIERNEAQQQQPQPPRQPQATENYTNKFLHLLTSYGDVGQLAAIFSLAFLIIHITASVICMATAKVTGIVASLFVIETSLNMMMIIWILLHQKILIHAWLWFHGIALVLGAVVDYPSIPFGMIIITASCFLSVYILLHTFDHNIRIEVRRNPASVGTTNSARNEVAASRNVAQQQPQQPQPQQPQDNRLTERELRTISETIAAQDHLIQQRYAAYMRLLTASDAELPTYEEIMKAVQEEKKRPKEEEKSEGESPPPSYLMAMTAIAQKNRRMPDVE